MVYLPGSVKDTFPAASAADRYSFAVSRFVCGPSDERIMVDRLVSVWTFSEVPSVAHVTFGSLKCPGSESMFNLFGFWSNSALHAREVRMA